MAKCVPYLALFIAVTEAATYAIKNNLCGSANSPYHVQPWSDVVTVTSETGRTGGFYSSNIDCTVTFRAPANYRIRLTFTFMEMSPGCNDWLKLYDDTSVNSGLMSTLCGTGYQQLPNPYLFTSSSNAITLRFVTDSQDDSKRGFTFQYERITETSFSSGITCYSCSGCAVRNYIGLPGTVTVGGCYSCYKIRDTRLSTATRGCHTTQPAENLLISGYASGAVAVTGCQNVTTNTGYVMEYCVCRHGYCNTGTRLRGINVALLTAFMTLLIKT